MVRVFIEERKGLALDVQSIDVMHFENRRLPFRQSVNSRGEVPVLQLDNGRFITETVAICEYLDEGMKLPKEENHCWDRQQKKEQKLECDYVKWIWNWYSQLTLGGGMMPTSH